MYSNMSTCGCRGRHTDTNTHAHTAFGTSMSRLPHLLQPCNHAVFSHCTNARPPMLLPLLTVRMHTK